MWTGGGVRCAAEDARASLREERKNAMRVAGPCQRKAVSRVDADDLI